MTHPIAFVLVEEHDLIRLSHHLIGAEVTYKDALVGKHQIGRAGAFLRTFVPAVTTADYIAESDRFRVQKQLD
jgi:hypothetical protein